MATLSNKSWHPSTGIIMRIITGIIRIETQILLEFRKIILLRLRAEWQKLCQEFSKTESCVLVALSQLDEFLLNPQAWAHFGPVPETSRKSNRESQGTNEDRSQNDPHPEVGVSLSQSSDDLSAEETSHIFSLASSHRISLYFIKKPPTEKFITTDRLFAFPDFFEQRLYQKLYPVCIAKLSVFSMTALENGSKRHSFHFI